MRTVLLALAIAALLTPAAWAAPGDKPDLIVTERTAFTTSVRIETFPATHCAVVEGMISEGTHRLVRFPTVIANIGTIDLKIGNPASHPEWYTFASCHGHYHYNHFAEYRLLDGAGNVVGTGHKQGFCVVDTNIYDPTIAKHQRRQKYTNCTSNQGLSVGWSDTYLPDLDGQWIVIDNVPSGVYTLEVTVNPTGLIPELSFANNTKLTTILVP